MSEFIDYMNHQNKDSKVWQSWIKTDEYAIRQEDRKIDRHSFLGLHKSENLGYGEKCLYTNTKQKKESFTIVSFYIGLDAYGKKKGT